MRINRADIDLWRAREMQGLRRSSESSSTSSVLDHRFDVAAKRSLARRRSRATDLDGPGATPPLDNLLEQTTGNVVILRYLIDSVLPALPMSADVRQSAQMLFTEDMDHHLRVLDAANEEDRKLEFDGKLGQP